MFKEPRNTFQFDWSHLGNIDLGRPNLGNVTSVAIYRLMQYTIRDSAIKHTDVDTAARIFFDAGVSAGSAVFENLIQPVDSLNELISKLQTILKNLGVGILRMEETDLDQMKFTLTVAEDLDCSGLPIQDEAICTFDEGFIAGIFQAFTGDAFNVKEVDCWCTGERVCRFVAQKAR